MKLPQEKWIRLLSRKPRPCREKVIVTGKLIKGRAFKIAKPHWKKHFSKYKGLGLSREKGLELVPRNSGGNEIVFPEWATGMLEVGSRDLLCVTERDGKFCLKKIKMRELPSGPPGWIVIDEFKSTSVARWWSSRPNLCEIEDELERLASLVGRFSYNPLASFKKMGGRLGLLARREFFGGLTRSDLARAKDYQADITKTQEENGSWRDSAAETAFSLIRLLDVGATARESTVARARDWLLAAIEPVGLPGLFMNTEERAGEYNARKANGAYPGEFKSGRQMRYTKTEREAFRQHWDILPKALSCEPRITWSSAVAVEALLRCGLEEHPRVMTAIRTLLALRRKGRWCGCGIFGRSIERCTTASIDFNRFPVPSENKDLYSLDWFNGENEFRKLTCGADAGSCRCVAAGRNNGMLLKNHSKLNPCSIVMHRALSFHPGYHDSNLEMIAALECSFAQNPNGEWLNNYLSGVFDFLGRFDHPLSAFLVLRSVPLLIREQCSDGLWDRMGPDRHVAGFMILRALKTFGFLETLLPAQTTREARKKESR
ncbi:hypothetical protein ACFL1X_00530 [Candidatus Hydrogenedentota bacterium]